MMTVIRQSGLIGKSSQMTDKSEQVNSKLLSSSDAMAQQVATFHILQTGVYLQYGMAVMAANEQPRMKAK